MSGSRQLPLPLPHEPSFAREDFLGFPSNAAALALIDAWPNWPAPLMGLAGPEGSGKSHLAAIFAREAGATRLDGRSLDDPEEVTRGAALVIDDADAVRDEAGLFHLINFARSRGVSVLLMARKAPDFWGVATPDLLSRLRLAPFVEIAPPEPELIEAALAKLFADRQLSVEPSLVGYIARRLERSLGAARALVEALDAEALAQGRKVTRAMAAALLQGDEAG